MTDTLPKLNTSIQLNQINMCTKYHCNALNRLEIIKQKLQNLTYLAALNCSMACFHSSISKNKVPLIQA
jgi:hypothetical protein